MIGGPVEAPAPSPSPEGAFEIIGGPVESETFPEDESSDAEDHEAEAISEETLEEAELHFSEPTSRTEISIEILGPREVYSRRRVWLARKLGSLDDSLHFLVEERQLRSEESFDVSIHEADLLEESYLYPALARTRAEGRMLTLFRAPLGQSLLAWRQRQDTPRDSSILTFLRPLVEALETFHADGRLHLHVAPQNVWFHQGRITFTGLERLMPHPIEPGSTYRAYPGFSAPEILGRSRASIGPRSDIYSLGALTYFLITGNVPPVAPETAFAPALSPRDFQPDFPVGWVDAILQATDPIPEQRQTSPNAFLESLEHAALLTTQRRDERPRLRYIAAAERHIGFNKARRSPINQDHVFLGRNEPRGRLLLVVGDGVSTASYGSGDLASAFLVKRAAEHWKTFADTEHLHDPRALIHDIIAAANQDIIDYINQQHAPIHGAPSEVMGSTALVALIDRGTLHLGSLGDSRCYLIRKEHMECITRDHNLFTLSLIDGMHINDVLLMPHGDALARCLGTFNLNAEKHLESFVPAFDYYTLNLLPQDNILLCTDGLFDYAGSTYEESERNIRTIVLQEPHPGLASLELILLANRGGGGDNIGVALVKVS